MSLTLPARCHATAPPDLLHLPAHRRPVLAPHPDPTRLNSHRSAAGGGGGGAARGGGVAPDVDEPPQAPARHLVVGGGGKLR